MKQTYLEALGIADQERVITQSLAWLLGPNSSLDTSRRQLLIDDLFGPCPPVDSLLVYTELDRIDLALIWPSRLLIAVEVKLKSRLGRDQLAELNDVVRDLTEQTWLHPAGTPEAQKFLLTFSNEKPGDYNKKPGDSPWNPRDFSHVRHALADATVGDGNIIASEFSSLLEKLLEAREAFCSDHTRHPEVFHFSGTTNMELLQRRQELAEMPAHTAFIVGNKLSRIFIETLLRRVVDAAGEPKASVGEDRGKAHIIVPLFEHIQFPAIVQDRFRAALQYQAGAWKLQLAAMTYSRSDRSWWPAELVNKLDSYLVGHDTRPNAARERAYRAWQRSAKTELLDTRLPAFIDEFKRQCDWARELWAETLAALQADGLVRPDYCGVNARRPTRPGLGQEGRPGGWAPEVASPRGLKPCSVPQSP